MEPAQPSSSPGGGSGEGPSSDRPSAIGTSAASSATRSNTGSGADSSTLGRQLGGDLPCIVCGYNLKGLSIRGVCPECGAAVRAAILAVVDPQARVLQPIKRPRLVAGATILWISGALGAALVCWLPHLFDIFELAGLRRLTLPPLRHAVLGFAIASALGAAVLVRPHARIPFIHSAAAALAALLYIPLAWMLHENAGRQDFRIAHSVLTRWQPTWPLTLDVVWMSLMVAAILMLVRPIARLLVARSLLLRSGRVDRQTLWAMAVAAVLIAAGQVVGTVAFAEVGSLGTIGVTFGIVMMVVGALLLTIGLFGSLIDAIRIARAIVRPHHTYKQVIRSGVKSASSVR